MTTDQLRAALDRLAYWAEVSADHLPDNAATEELLDAIHAAHALLGQ
jgi:hypothetical protein